MIFSVKKYYIFRIPNGPKTSKRTSRSIRAHQLFLADCMMCESVSTERAKTAFKRQQILKNNLLVRLFRTRRINTTDREMRS